MVVRTSSAMSAPITPDDIDRAARRIGGHVRRTVVLEHRRLLLKLELFQHAGSFKARGAFNRVLAEGQIPPSGLITASGGNHGAAVAYVGRSLGVPVEVYVPSSSPELKRRNIERFGARAVIVPGYYDDAQAAANARQACSAALMVHPFDHPATIAGQGTMAREVGEQVGGLDTIVVGAGGGGFLAGQAAWFGAEVRVVSVEPETSQCVHAALAAGQPVDVPVSGIAADSLGAKRVGDVPWPVIRDHVDVAVVVPDEEIRAAQRALWDELRIVVEPGGAAAYAALRCGAYSPGPAERVVVAVCGANCDPRDVVS